MPIVPGVDMMKHAAETNERHLQMVTNTLLAATRAQPAAPAAAGQDGGPRARGQGAGQLPAVVPLRAAPGHAKNAAKCFVCGKAGHKAHSCHHRQFFAQAPAAPPYPLTLPPPAGYSLPTLQPTGGNATMFVFER